MFEFRKTGLHQRQTVLLRAWVAGIFALICLLLLVGRLWFLQVDRYDNLSARADQNRITIVPVPPRRGQITDREGGIMATNLRDYTLVVTRAQVEGKIEDLLDRLRELVYISDSDQRKFLRLYEQSGRYAPVLLRNNLNDIEASWFAVYAFEFPGVNLQARWVRSYPQKESAAHVLGFVGRISEADEQHLEATDQEGNYRGTQEIGKKGIEKTWETVLHGRTGIEELEVTATGRPVRELNRTDPIPGDNLELALDIGLQKLAEAQFQGRRGALVAIQPKTGEILAFVSSPSFDPNLFIDGIDVENWRKLNESPDHPLINRPLYGTYPIGSTYKPFVALGALEMGLRGPHERLSDPGYFELGGQRFRNAGGAAYGATDMHRAIVVSSDTYFYSLGAMMDVDALHDFSKQFGFGQITGIDLDGERRGVLPSRAWKREAYKKPSQQHWYQGETVSVAVGQGYNAFTLLQLAQATAVLANNGVYMKPHLVRRMIDPQTGQFTYPVRAPQYTIPLKPGNLKVVQDAMVDVVRKGTARRAFVGATYQAAGKTGTAQVFSLKGAKYKAQAVDERLRDHALFMAYAPVDNPQIALALIVENGGWGASVAAPIARTLFDYWLAPSRIAHRQQRLDEEQRSRERLEAMTPSALHAATDEGHLLADMPVALPEPDQGPAPEAAPLPDVDTPAGDGAQEEPL
ncbi:penicillin-binding protein 2 [Castellaniella sp.]|uniref:penicillin-binding protein 2 n=1 Tax=Castellaniella sp. TaxID=1955812 RepID=UPI002AFEF902|nr:penicillin-binding protein 2 [Castellaniella sp.]